jgi:N-acetylglucosamine-6-sulfatase
MRPWRRRIGLDAVVAGNPGRAVVLALLVVLGLGVLVAAEKVEPASDEPSPHATRSVRPTAATGAPNVIVIQTDDQSLSETSPRTMPNTYRLLGRGGSVLRNYIVTSPDCCPSRASLLTGDYPHNHGVMSNRIGYRGLIEPGNMLPVWLRDAGYVTAHLGKFMNKYDGSVPVPGETAPGWDHWFTYVGPDRYYAYQVSVDGELKTFDDRPRDYVGRVLDRHAVTTVDRYIEGPAPLYLQLDERTPHASHSDPTGRCDPAAVPDPRDYDLIGRTRVPHAPSYNEANVSDKPPFISRLPRLTREDRRKVDRHYACAVAALRGVDRTVGHVFDAVKRAGELDDTVFIFTSDNGLLNGEHRLADTKQYPYEESIRVPMMIRLPGEPTPPVVRKPTANIDIAPTILDLAHAAPCAAAGGCRTIDGRSLLPLLTGVGSFPAHRHLLVEFSMHKRLSHRGSTCSFAGVWTPKSFYALHDRTVLDPATGVCEPSHELEHYDLVGDPYELKNLAARPSSAERRRLRRLAVRLSRLRDCAGSGVSTDEVSLGRPLCE